MNLAIAALLGAVAFQPASSARPPAHLTIGRIPLSVGYPEDTIRTILCADFECHPSDKDLLSLSDKKTHRALGAVGFKDGKILTVSKTWISTKEPQGILVARSIFFAFAHVQADGDAPSAIFVDTTALGSSWGFQTLAITLLHGKSLHLFIHDYDLDGERVVEAELTEDLR